MAYDAIHIPAEGLAVDHGGSTKARRGVLGPASIKPCLFLTIKRSCCLCLPCWAMAGNGACARPWSVLRIGCTLSQEERAALLPSGRAAVFHDRVSGVRTSMHKAGLLESPRRG